MGPELLARLLRAREALEEDVELAEALRRAREAATRACRGRSTGKALIKWGILLALSPEPLVSEVAGGSLVLLGLALRAGDRAGLSDLTAEARRALGELEAMGLGLR